jgi:hypothetical protein
MAFLNIGGAEFKDIQEFIEFLESDEQISSLPSNLQVVATISTLKTIEDFINNLKNHGFEIEEYHGKLLLISKMTKGEKVLYYAFFDDRNNIHLFLTVARKTDDIPNTLLDYMKRSGYISNLWITPKIMQELKDRLIEEHEDLLITYFSSKRSPNSEIPAQFRPDVTRGIQYRGDDGKRTLEEMEFYYGVLPKILEIRLPNGVYFRIDNKGIITLFRGSFGDVFKIIESIVGKLIKIKYAIEESSYTIHKVGINNQFSHAIQTPWSIVLPNGLKIKDIPNFCRSLRDDEWDFTLLDHMLLKESSYFSARIIDNNNNSLFDIASTGNCMDVFPIEQTDISSCIRFYEFLVENVDPLATTG